MNGVLLAAPSSPATRASKARRTRVVEPIPVEPDTDVDVAERARTLKQSVLADVSCVLARSGGADIDRRQALSAARNICEILFAHPQQHADDIPRLFWETPLGQAVGSCYATAGNAAPDVPLRLSLPADVAERLRVEAEARDMTIEEWALEKMSR